MPSRMDRYYNDDDLVNKRSSKNVTLYNKIYDEDSKYNNVYSTNRTWMLFCISYR